MDVRCCVELLSHWTRKMTTIFYHRLKGRETWPRLFSSCPRPAIKAVGQGCYCRLSWPAPRVSRLPPEWPCPLAQPPISTYTPDYTRFSLTWDHPTTCSTPERTERRIAAPAPGMPVGGRLRDSSCNIFCQHCFLFHGIGRPTCIGLKEKGRW